MSITLNLQSDYWPAVRSPEPVRPHPEWPWAGGPPTKMKVRYTSPLRKRWSASPNQHRGREDRVVPFPPPSEPDRRISRIRLSSRWLTSKRSEERSARRSRDRDEGPAARPPRHPSHHHEHVSRPALSIPSTANRVPHRHSPEALGGGKRRCAPKPDAPTGTACGRSSTP